MTSSGDGISATKARRISTISAAALRSGAASTSCTPLTNICHARIKTGTGSVSASSVPRTRSASGKSAESRRLGTARKREIVCTRSSMSVSIRPGSAPRAWAASAKASALSGLPVMTASSRSNTTCRSASPSMSLTSSAPISGAEPSAAVPWAMAWSSKDNPSRTEPSAARAISAKASTERLTCSFWAMRPKRAVRSA